jgi:DNA-binding NarL/FixJ family response regulator
MININITEDQKLMVQSLSDTINRSGVAQVTNLYYTLQSCREGLAKQLPDILLLDIGMTDGDGLHFCSETAKLYPELKIVMLTGHKEYNIAKFAMNNGAHGYILKDVDTDEMFTGIEMVYKGKQFLCKEIADLLKDRDEIGVIWLTETEKRVLQLCAEGYTQKQIAAKLCRTRATIKSHIRNIHLKLDVNNTVQAVRKYIEMYGMFKNDSDDVRATETTGYL